MYILTARFLVRVVTTVVLVVTEHVTWYARVVPALDMSCGTDVGL